MLKRLMERARNNKYIVCLDRVEHLKGKEIIGQLIQVGICVIIACNSYEYLSTLDLRVRTGISATIELKPYSSKQAFQILKGRAEQVLEGGSYSDDILRKIVEKTRGNISIALNVLKAIALKAKNEHRKSIDEVDLDNILLEHDCPERLNADERVIMRILQEWKSLPANRLHAFYVQKSRYPKSERAFRNYMENLCFKGLVKALGEKRGRTYEIIEGETNG